MDRVTYSNGGNILDKNNLICKNELDYYQYSEVNQSALQCLSELYYYHVLGIAKTWQDNEQFDISGIISDLLCGLSDPGCLFSFIIKGDGKGINVYFGSDINHKSSLKQSLVSLFPNINIKEEDPSLDGYQFGGAITGFPTNKIKQDDSNELQIDHLIRGIQGNDFMYCILAEGIASGLVDSCQTALLEEMEIVDEYQNQHLGEGISSRERQSFIHKNYFDNVQKLSDVYQVGLERGMWRYAGYFLSYKPNDGKKNEEKNPNVFGNLIKSSFSGPDSKPEKIRVSYLNYQQGDQGRSARFIRDCIGHSAFISYPLSNFQNYPIKYEKIGRLDLSLVNSRYFTFVNSDQLAVLSSLPMKEYPGYYIDNYVEFDLSSRPRMKKEHPVIIGDIVNAGGSNDSNIFNKYSIDKDDYTRHALIIGITGGGKTNTSKSLLRTLWREEKIPFLVIESAKREYWELRNIHGFEDIMVYTLGSEDPDKSVRYRLNPFETLPGIALQSHIDMLLATFKTAFELYAPMPYVLETAVYEVYKDRGWNIVTNKNDFGLTLYPTLSDLYDKISYTVKNMGYDKEVSSNIRSALEARINSLMIGGKGAMLNTSKSIPIDTLLSAPTVLELEDIGDDETKSFVIGILLVQLYEYRKYQKDKINGAKKLQHILMVEEAHRLLKNVSESANPTQAKSVEFFCNMLAEIRTYGQGIFIADQIPTKLAPDTIKNTNLKIVHRTVAKEDREAMGMAMNMTESQIDYLSSLRRGYAAVYAEGDNRPKCVLLPYVKDDTKLTRTEVITPIQNKVNSGLIDTFVPIHCGCTYCEKKRNCPYSKANRDLIKKLENNQQQNIKEVFVKGNNFNPERLNNFMKQFERIGHANETMNNVCLIGFLFKQWAPKLENGDAKKFISNYIAYKNGKYE